jgi:hypothetical protein
MNELNNIHNIRVTQPLPGNGSGTRHLSVSGPVSFGLMSII